MGKYNKKILEHLILIENKSYEEIGREYGVTGAAVKKAALRLGIELEKRRSFNEKKHFGKGVYKIDNKTSQCIYCGKEFIKYATKTNKYCSNQCQQDHRHSILYDQFLDGNSDIQRANYNCGIFKKDILKEQNNKCDICGCDNNWNGDELVFILDHIDGDASHNTRDNIRLVCPNCDSQLPTYKSKNKNGARHYYRYHKEKE